MEIDESKIKCPRWTRCEAMGFPQIFGLEKKGHIEKFCQCRYANYGVCWFFYIEKGGLIKGPEGLLAYWFIPFMNFGL